MTGQKIELPCKLGFAIGALLAGLLLTAIAVPLALAGKPTAEWVFIGGLGVPLLVYGLRGVALRPPQLRATPAGLWFAKARSVAIEFHQRRTLFRLPVRAWLGSILCVGDVDVDASGNALVVASQLDAMRALACGIEDGVVAGSAPLPSARVVP